MHGILKLLSIHVIILYLLYFVETVGGNGPRLPRQHSALPHSEKTVRTENMGFPGEVLQQYSLTNIPGSNHYH